ncbi:MAG TPA: AMP-binding protein [Alphaproteobacteria bacterium]|nr:AMP-binding protein [Alphaproteobacteria bacterium]
MQTAYDLLWRASERTPNHLALVDDRSDKKFTYRALMAEIDAVAAGLAARGVKAGTRFATVLPNLLEHALIILALHRLGAVPALINFRLKPEEIAELIRQGQIAGALVPPAPALAEAMAAVLPKGGALLVTGAEPLGAAQPFAACRGDAKTLPPVPRPDPEDPAYIFYTSGTTGLPKGVVLPHRVSEARVTWLSTQAGLRHGTHNRALGVMPFSHAIGFFGVFLVTLAYNGTVYLMAAFDPAATVDMIERHRITYFFAIPTHYHAICMAPNYKPERVASLELCLFGGVAIEKPLIERLDREWQATLRHIYGTTELMNSLYNPDPVPAPATLRPGFFSRTRAVRIGGGPDDQVGPGEEGELIVDMDVAQAFSGYLNRPDATAEKVRGGWYYTGDVVLVEPSGDYTLAGRVDDMIRSGGESIHPEEVEAVLVGHPAIRELSVVGVVDPHWGQIVVACVVPGAPVTAAELDAHCRASPLAGYKRPRGYMFMDTLPKNAANKVLRRVLRDAGKKARTGEGPVEFHAIERR